VSETTQDDTVPAEQPAAQDGEQQPASPAAGPTNDDQVAPATKRRFRRSKPVPVVSPGSDVVLGSLASTYKPGQHERYVVRLSEAVRDPKNLNIALTGRYGSGKSSVLDEFEARHKDTTLRLAISTLAPTGGESENAKTNRIQKELVKQIVYSAPKKVGRNSRFSRIAVPSRAKLLFEAAVVVAAVGLGLLAFGRLPELKGVPADAAWWVRPLIWIGIGTAIVGAITAVRVATHGRFRIGDVKAGGTSVSLTEKAPTYFDQFIDELVHYFDETSKDIVIFEDLDRFEEPQIFQELRELNVLLNDTTRRRRKRDGNWFTQWLVRRLEKRRPGLPDRLRKRWPRRRSAFWLGTGEPLRFVYAVKDSLFEHLGEDSKKAADAGDAAAAETIRANRTKFFDVVVPIVPFISHRNARELLDTLLKDAGVEGIDRNLVSVVARHGTDMRLLRNICNEYVVFAEQLLVGDQVAPDLDQSKLFALVAYKNFHLTDFELITRRASALDRLLQYKYDLVRNSVEALEARRRVLLSNPEKVRKSKQFAQRLGTAVRVHAEGLIRARGYSPDLLRFEVGAEKFEPSDTSTERFWAAVDTNQGYGIMALRANRNSSIETVDRAQIEALFPEGLQVSAWARIDEEARVSELGRNKAAAERVRGAGFRDFVSLTQYTLNLRPSEVRGQSLGAGQPMADSDGTAEDEANEDFTFADLIDTVLSSDLARDLIRGGFLDQNFALYAARFYGQFISVDVATFVVQAVQPNQMLIDYPLKGEGDVENLLTEVDDDFLTTVAAYNVDVVDYLLTTAQAGIDDVVARLVANDDEARATFLATYFTSGAQKEALAGHLAAHSWHGVFTYLATNEEVADDVRPDLVGTAMAHCTNNDYDLPTEVKAYIESKYSEMKLFTDDQPTSVSVRASVIIAKAGVVIPHLSNIGSNDLHRWLVKNKRYTLTAANLFSAIARSNTTTAELNALTISLDHLAINNDVLAYCLDNPQKYLDAQTEDKARTKYAITSPETLERVLTDITNDDGNDFNENWSTETLDELLRRTAAGASLPTLDDVASFLWQRLAGADLFHASLDNVERYIADFGIDVPLGSMLTRYEIGVDDGPLSNDEIVRRTKAAVAFLHAPDESIEPQARVELVKELKLPGLLDVQLLNAEPNHVFRYLLEERLVPDTADTFAHFLPAGWTSVGPAMKVSAKIEEFLTPALVKGLLDQLLLDTATAAKLAGTVIEQHEVYLPAGADAMNADALVALGVYAKRSGTVLPPELVVRIAATHNANAEDALDLLRKAQPPADPSQIVQALTHLGQPYAEIATPGAKFKVDERHKDLILRVKRAGLIEATRSSIAKNYTVKVPPTL
jgi:hypothetical protein